MKKPPEVSIIFSFYNEEAVLKELIRRVRLVMASCIASAEVKSYEIIFINDCSRDRSEDVIRAEMGLGDIILLNTSRNFGNSECKIAGFQESSGDVVVYMDADLQDPPELLPTLIREWRSDDDVEVVYTTRLKRHRENWFKLLLIKVGYRVVNRISEIPLPVDSGDFKLLSRRVVEEILRLNESSPYLRGLVTWVGFKQAQVFYDREGRFDGPENTKVRVLSRKNIYYWLDSALISFSDAPLKMVLFLGMVAVTLGFVLSVYAVVQKILGYSAPGWTAIVVTISFMTGIQFLVLGILGLYVGAIFRQTKGRPHYIIKNRVKA